jgi:ketosteroid isomerase-like protein
MSQENVEVVRRFHAPGEGKDLVPRVREVREQLGHDPEPSAVLAFWAQDPGWRHLHPDIEWDPGTGVLGTAHGVFDLTRWWDEWVEVWESYVFRVAEYRDLGDWVLALTDAQGRARQGIPVEMRVFELYRIRDGKIAVYRSFGSEQKALEAAGLSEQDAHADS